MATFFDSFCSWCRSARWQYRCSMCDPRMEKTLCSNCSTLWHSRGFARTHQLTSSYGETRSFSAWGLQQDQGVSNDNDSTMTETKPAASEEGSSDTAASVQAQEVAVNGAENISEEEKSMEEATLEDKSGQEETKQDEDEPMEENFDFEVVGESVDSGEDTMSVEQTDESEDKGKDAAVEGKSLDGKAETASIKVVECANPKADEQSTSSGDQEKITQQSSASATLPAFALETKASTPAPAQTLTTTSAPTSSPVLSPTHTSNPAPTAVSIPVGAPASSVPVSSTPDSASQVKTPTSTPAAAGQPRTERSSQGKPVDLDKLLRWFPTKDPVLTEMLASRIEEALVVEDALICARIRKCDKPSCCSVLLHYEHCKRDEICGDPKCLEISIVYKHRRACLKKDSSSANDGKRNVCPFCIRIRQRRSIGVCAALDHLISDQRRALQGAHSEANRNFCLQSINTWKQRKQLLRDETARLNQLAIESSTPIFNFPKYQWHFSDSLFIKREPTSLEVNIDTPTQGVAESSTNNNLMPTAEQHTDMQVDDGSSFTADDSSSTQQSEDTQEDSIPGTANFNADFINQLLRVKAESDDNSEMARREFDGVMELGYAIVDASFCAPSKAQRCLLNCKSILDHLQHHLDLQVCKQAMCGAVEHHFAHLSQCKARNESESCEYCLRVEERQLVRSVDFMEAEQPEAEAKVQKIINDITASFTNHHPDEREQEVIQLEDELDQAEANKQELLDKLGTGRSNLRKVRRNMEHRGISTSTSRRLPVHFAKARRSEGPGNHKKRRLADSSE